MEDSQILESISLLDIQDFKVLVDAAISYLHDKDKLEKFNKLNKTLIQIDNCKDIAKWLLKTVSIALKHNIEPNKISKYLQSNFGLDETKSNVVKELWEKHWSNLKDFVNNQSLMIGQLVDMEWKFGVTASTNTIDKFGNAFLQLKFFYSNGEKLESKYMELTLPQFYSFLHELNKAKSQMDYLS